MKSSDDSSSSSDDTSSSSGASDRSKTRVERKFEWAGFKLAAIHPKKAGGCQTAWGATCGRHRNVVEKLNKEGKPTCRCKKVMTIRGHFSSNEVLRRLKMWCLFGDAIPAKDDDAREQHQSMDIKTMPVYSDAELESLAAARP